ncbi:aminotransferase class IV family protein [bacterium]|nr:aminotransferase class IV family protein [bacterium]MBU1884733.1 aminotransferase class IV family protein [bacterium]
MSKNLLETIKIIDGEIQNLSYHQARYETSLRSLNLPAKYDLKEFITPPDKGIYRCRVIYNENDVRVEYFSYEYAPIDSLKLVTANTIEYSLKYEDRDELNTLFDMRESCDDILIVKNSLLTDTSKANIALFDGSTWYTPSQPLLYGTTRARYLDAGKIIAKPLHVNEIANFSQVAVLNAMVDFCIVKNGIIS